MNINIHLHENCGYKDTKCARCGRSYPDTVLNLEATIHHGAKEYECIDRKTCSRIARKLSY